MDPPEWRLVIVSSASSGSRGGVAAPRPMFERKRVALRRVREAAEDGVDLMAPDASA